MLLSVLPRLKLFAETSSSYMLLCVDSLAAPHWIGVRCVAIPTCAGTPDILLVSAFPVLVLATTETLGPIGSVVGFHWIHLEIVVLSLCL